MNVSKLIRTKCMMEVSSDIGLTLDNMFFSPLLLMVPEIVRPNEQLERDMSTRYVNVNSLTSSSSKWKTDLEIFEDWYLTDIFMEPMGNEDVYVNISTNLMHSVKTFPDTEKKKSTRKFNGQHNLSHFLLVPADNFFMVPSPVTTSNLCVWDPEKSFEAIALLGYPVKAEALQLLGCSACPDEHKARHFTMHNFEICVLKLAVSASLGMLLLWNIYFGLAPVSKYFSSTYAHSFTHNGAGPLVLHVCFICGGSRMISYSLITTNFWFTGLLLISAYLHHCKPDGIDTKILFIPRQMITTSLIFDLLIGSVDYFYAYGDADPHVSSISLLLSTLFVFIVGLGERHCIVYSVKAAVFLNIEIRVFGIGEGNDMPAGKSLDEKMTVPCITVWIVGTDSLSVPWYTNLLPFPEDTLSAILVFSTAMSICYMALNLQKSISLLNSVEELDQPFINDLQPILWLRKQKGVSVLHLSYKIVIILLPYGIETEKHVSFYHNNSLSSLPFLYLNLENKVLIEERCIVINQVQLNMNTKATQLVIGMKRAIGPRTNNRTRLI